jgi:hypothetical protein
VDINGISEYFEMSKDDIIRILEYGESKVDENKWSEWDTGMGLLDRIRKQ